MSPKPDRIVGRRDDHGYWTAWFVSDPLDAWGGESPHVALARLLASVGQSVHDWDTERLNDGDVSGEFEIRRRATCPECGGTGQYVGFTTVESCSACAGTGELGVRFAES